ncbi:MAG: hypothetical protein ACM3S1_06935 [Hyphomicrobiales bacterium]
MPDRAEHLAKAVHNEKLFAALDSSNFNDWRVTTLFYAALHLVDAYLAPLHHPTNHQARTKIVASDQFLRLLFVQYRELESRSREARYDCLHFTDAFVQNLWQADFEPLKKAIRAALP